MRRAAPVRWVLVSCLAVGCSTVRHRGSDHPGITEPNPSAVNRVYPASATLVARTVADVMSQDSIIDDVSMVADAGSKEYRNFSREDRQRLGISMLTPANDVNFNIKAKSKDGRPIAVAVRLKGESSAEVSLLYGFGGDSDLARDILDRVGIALESVPKDTAVAKASGSKAASRPGLPR